LKDNYAASFSAAAAREFAAKPQINLASAAGLKWCFKIFSLMKGPRDPLCHGHITFSSRFPAAAATWAKIFRLARLGYFEFASNLLNIFYAYKICLMGDSL
jgi:hypothetical protein